MMDLLFQAGTIIANHHWFQTVFLFTIGLDLSSYVINALVV